MRAEGCEREKTVVTCGLSPRPLVPVRSGTVRDACFVVSRVCTLRSAVRDAGKRHLDKRMELVITFFVDDGEDEDGRDDCSFVPESGFA